MKPPQNSDSKTRVKKQNLTSKTEIRQKSLKYLFLETPCIDYEDAEMHKNIHHIRDILQL